MCEYVNFPAAYTQHATTIQTKVRHTYDIAHSIHANASDIIYGAEICFSNLYLISFLVQYVWENLKVETNNEKMKWEKEGKKKIGSEKKKTLKVAKMHSEVAFVFDLLGTRLYRFRWSQPRFRDVQNLNIFYRKW